MLLPGVTVAQIGNTGYANSVKFMSMIYLSKINGQMSVFLLEEYSTKHSIKGEIQWGSTNSHFPLNTQNQYLPSYDTLVFFCKSDMNCFCIIVLWRILCVYDAVMSKDHHIGCRLNISLTNDKALQCISF